MFCEKTKSEENRPKAIIPQIFKPKKDDLFFDIEELNETELLSIALELFSNEQTQIFSAISFFDNYLNFYSVPLNVSLEIQKFFIKLLSTKEIPSDILEPSLKVISSISSSFSEKFDYSTFLTKLWNFLPNSNAFAAISSIVAANNAAANAITNPPFLPLLQELFQTDDYKMISGALGIFNSIAFNSEHTKNLEGIFNQIFEFHKVADSSLKIQCYETFTNLISSQYWCKTIINSSYLSTIFQIDIFDQTQNYDGQLLSALRFLNSLIVKSEENPEEIIIKAEAIPLLMEGFANQNQIIQYESIYLVEITMKKLQYIPEFIWSYEIISKILFKKITNNIDNGNFNIFQYSLHCLCMICIRATDEQIKIFIENNFVSIVCQYIDSIDKPFLHNCLLAILKLMISSTSAEDFQVVNEISNSELFVDFLSKTQSETAIAIQYFLSKYESQIQ